MKQNKTLKTLFLAGLVLFSVFSATATSTAVNDWQSDDIFLRGDGIDITVVSFQTHSSSDELQSTEIVISNQQSEVSETFTRGVTVENQTSTDETFTFAESELSSLPDGTWTIDVTENWEDGVTSTDSVDINAQYADVEIGIDSPNSQDTYGPPNDITVDWSSTNDYDESYSLESSDIVLEDGQGNTVSESLTRSTQVASGESVSEQVSFSPDRYSSLNEGTWTAEITDTWEHDSATETQSFSVSMPEIGIDFNNPSSGETVEVNESDNILGLGFNVSVEAADTYTVDYVLSDSEGNTIPNSETMELNSGESTAITNSLDISNLNLDNQLTLSVDVSSDSSGSTSDEIGFDVSTVSNNDTKDLDVSSSLDDVSYSDSGGLSVERTASNSGSDSVELLSTEVALFQEGSLFSDSSDVGATISDSSRTDTYNFDLDLDPGDYTVEVTDSWGNDNTSSGEGSFTVEDTSSSDGSTDGSGDDSDSGSTDDSTSDDSSSGSDSGSTEDGSDSDGSTDDSSDDSTDGSGDDSGSDGSTDDSTSDDGSTDDSSDTDGESSNEEDDSSTGGQGSNTDGDSSVSGIRSVLEKEIAAGFTVRTVLLGIGALLLLMVLFWRSNYELTI